MGSRDPDGIAYARHGEVDGVDSFQYFGPAKHLARHAHATYQLTLYGGGAHRIDIGGAQIIGSATSAVIVQAGEPHTSEPTSAEMIGIRGAYIDTATMEAAAASIWQARGTVVFAQPLIDNSRTIRRLDEALGALARGTLESEIVFRSSLIALLRRYGAPTGPVRPLVGAAARVARARDLLHDHFADEISLSRLAETAELSRYHLIRLFRHQYGMTPFEYQRNVRVQKACDALSRGATIAAAVAVGGFADQSHLGRMFVASMGVTPGQYLRGRFTNVHAVRRSLLTASAAPNAGRPNDAPSSYVDVHRTPADRKISAR